MTAVWGSACESGYSAQHTAGALGDLGHELGGERVDLLLTMACAA